MVSSTATGTHATNLPKDCEAMQARARNTSAGAAPLCRFAAEPHSEARSRQQTPNRSNLQRSPLSPLLVFGSAQSSPVVMADSNQYAALQGSPIVEEGKVRDSSSRSMKDDIKQQAFEAREGVKAKAAVLKEQLAGSDIVHTVTTQLGKGLEFAKAKAANLTGDPSIEKASNDELVEKADEQWTTVKKEVKHRGNKAAKELDAKIDEKLTSKQKAQLNRGVKQAKHAGVRAQKEAVGLFDRVLSNPQLRSTRRFIKDNKLELPLMIISTILTLWLSLTIIRLVTMAATPRVPEFDIHSKEASMNWLKWHAGEYKDRATDMKDSLSGRAASFLANHQLDKLQQQAIDWKDIGMKRLGLAEPTWSESIWAYATGHPVTWQGRVESVLELAKRGIQTSAVKQGINSMSSSLKDSLGIHQPTMWERAANWVTGYDPSLQGRMQATVAGLGAGMQAKAAEYGGGINGAVTDIKDKLVEGVTTVRAHLPGGADAAAQLEAARLAAYKATHPSTLDNIKNTAEYLKNRVVHGSEEAAHIAQDKAQRIMDEAKYKTGL